MKKAPANDYNDLGESLDTLCSESFKALIKLFRIKQMVKWLAKMLNKVK